jgi:hypothetical protein
MSRYLTRSLSEYVKQLYMKTNYFNTYKDKKKIDRIKFSHITANKKTIDYEFLNKLCEGIDVDTLSPSQISAKTTTNTDTNEVSMLITIFEKNDYTLIKNYKLRKYIMGLINEKNCIITKKTK